MGCEQCLDRCQIAIPSRVINRLIFAATGDADQRQHNQRDGDARENRGMENPAAEKEKARLHVLGIASLREIGKHGFSIFDRGLQNADLHHHNHERC
jgi:hypothetical protein